MTDTPQRGTDRVARNGPNLFLSCVILAFVALVFIASIILVFMADTVKRDRPVPPAPLSVQAANTSGAGGGIS